MPYNCIRNRTSFLKILIYSFLLYAWYEMCPVSVGFFQNINIIYIEKTRSSKNIHCKPIWKQWRKEWEIKISNTEYILHLSFLLPTYSVIVIIQGKQTRLGSYIRHLPWKSWVSKLKFCHFIYVFLCAGVGRRELINTGSYVIHTREQICAFGYREGHRERIFFEVG